MEDFKPFSIERPWGNFRQFTKNNLSTVKILFIKPNEQLSLQSHSKRSEFCQIIQGSGFIEIENLRHAVKSGEEYIIPVNTKHRIGAGAEGLMYLEISFGDFEEDDEIRYEDKYGRA